MRIVNGVQLVLAHPMVQSAAVQPAGIGDCFADPKACLTKGVVAIGGKIVDVVTSEPVQTVKQVSEKGVGGYVADQVTQVAEDQFTEFLWTAVQSLVDGTQVLFRFIVQLLLMMTHPQVEGEFIYTMAGRIFYISLPLIMLFAMLRIISDSIRAKALAGTHGAFFGAAGSLLGTIMLLPLTALGVSALDGVAGGLLGATLGDGDRFVDQIVSAFVSVGTVAGNIAGSTPISGPIAPWQVPAGGIVAAAIIIGVSTFVLFLACLSIGLALVTRNMLLYIVIAVGPLCLSGLAWKPTRQWASKWMGWMVALLFTKLAIVVVLGLGVLAILHPGVKDGGSFILTDLVTMLAGLMMIILAAFMPVACLSLFGWMGEFAVREISGAGMAAQGFMSRVPAHAVDAGQGAIDRVRSIVNKSASSGGSSGDPGLVGGAESTAGSGGAGGSASAVGSGAGASGGGLVQGAAGASGAGGAAGGAVGGAATGAVGSAAAAAGPVGLAAAAVVGAVGAVKSGAEAVADATKAQIASGVSELTGSDAGGEAGSSSSSNGGGEGGHGAAGALSSAATVMPSGGSEGGADSPDGPSGTPAPSVSPVASDAVAYGDGGDADPKAEMSEGQISSAHHDIAAVPMAMDAPVEAVVEAALAAPVPTAFDSVQPVVPHGPRHRADVPIVEGKGNG